MRILICFPRDGETDQALVDASKECGHETGFVDANIPFDLYKHINSRNGEYDLVLMSRTMDLYPSFVRAKNRYPDIKFAMWNVDVRGSLDDWGLLVEFVREVDLYFTVGMGRVKDWQMVNPQTYFLSQGIQKERYHKIEPTIEDRNKFTCDVSFIGNCIPRIHRERRYLLETLRNSHVDFKHLEGIYGRDHNAAVACSKINIGITHSPDCAYYVSVRDWKIIAGGGILLERNHPGLEEMFGGKVALYESPGDCISKIQDIFSDYGTWKKNALKLHEWAMATQTYADRVNEIVNIVEMGGL